jgi:hypothetical protein
MSGPFGPFEAQVERLGDTLINKVSDEIFGDSGAARSTRVVIYNHTQQDLYFLGSNFDSGGFSPGSQPNKIEAGTIGGYKVESHGLMTGVTGAEVRFGVVPTDETWALRIVSSNPYAGDNTFTADEGEGFKVRATISVGNTSQLDADVYAA